MVENAETIHDYEGWRGSHWRRLAWLVAAFILLMPLIAMQFTDEVVWTGSDFIFAGILLFVPLGVYELVARTSGNPAYRAGACMALVATLLILWLSAAVGITDAGGDRLYHLAIAVGIVGTFVARFRPQGMARAMFATSLALASAGVVSLVTGLVAPHNSVLEILSITEFFVALFAGSGLLFLEAARGGAERGGA